MPHPLFREARTQAKFDAVSESRSAFVPKTAEPMQRDVGGAPAEPWWEKTKFNGESESHAQCAGVNTRFAM